jgi:hypothetical protein
MRISTTLGCGAVTDRETATVIHGGIADYVGFAAKPPVVCCDR